VGPPLSGGVAPALSLGWSFVVLALVAAAAMAPATRVHLDED
jgi:hypothetical protein